MMHIYVQKRKGFQYVGYFADNGDVRTKARNTVNSLLVCFVNQPTPHNTIVKAVKKIGLFL